MSLSFSKRLEKAIADSPLKQTEIAEIAGITPPYLSDLKTGKKTNPSQDLVAKIAETLCVPYRWLLLGDEDVNLMEKPENAESSANPYLLREDPVPYRADKWKTHFETLIAKADAGWLLDRVEEFQEQAFAGDASAKAILAEILPRLRQRLPHTKP